MLTVAQFQQWCHRLHLSPQASEVVACVRSSPPARRIGSRASNASGTYASRKLGCAIQFESRKVELWAVYTMEHDPQVLEYYDQPATLELRYQAKSGRAVTVSHTPDFLVLRQDGMWLEEWKQEDKLLELAISQPHRYQRDERGRWRCPLGEEAAQRLGLSYRVRSPAELSLGAIRNLIFLENYFFAPGVEPAPATRLVDRVRSFPGLSLAALTQEYPQVPLDTVFALIARSPLDVDLEASPVIEHEAVLRYPDRATAEAHALLATKRQKSCRAAASSCMTSFTGRMHCAVLKWRAPAEPSAMIRSMLGSPTPTWEGHGCGASPSSTRLSRAFGKGGGTGNRGPAPTGSHQPQGRFHDATAAGRLSGRRACTRTRVDEPGARSQRTNNSRKGGVPGMRRDAPASPQGNTVRFPAHPKRLMSAPCDEVRWIRRGTTWELSEQKASFTEAETERE